MHYCTSGDREVELRLKKYVRYVTFKEVDK
jgi:hypothetical protein